MKLITLTTYLTLLIVVFCHVSVGNFDSAGPIQIVVPVNHTFQLEVEELKHILEADEIKDRHVVVLSVAGAFRQGKSFLLNFFLKYLYAQYQKHDVSDWMGENANASQVLGFKWRGGRKHETVGILMWSEIFTHDFENGEKIAIILIDTQGLFDRHSSIQDYTTIFALSMMLSSVQCYNLMNNIQEDDLQHLQLFTEYGRLAMEQTNEKPFQYLLFIVRDWSYAYEIDYGWHGQQLIDEIFNDDSGHTSDMRRLRERINSSFQEIGAFLLPHPGFAVARQKNFDGHLDEIDPEFKEYVKELVPALMAPENLVVKQINGRKVRAKDLVLYLQAYLRNFNENTLPQPKSMWTATAEASNQILYNDCLNAYVDSMQKSLNEMKSYYKRTDFQKLHQKAKSAAISELQEKPTLGDDELMISYRTKLENEIEAKFSIFNRTNDQKRRNFIEKAHLHNEKIRKEIEEMAKSRVIAKVIDNSDFSYFDVIRTFKKSKQAALDEFDVKKMDDGDISNGYHDELEQELDNFRSILNEMFLFYNESLHLYENSMENALYDSQSYFNTSELMELHQQVKNDTIGQFQAKFGCDKLSTLLQQRIQNEIEVKYPVFVEQNNVKRERFIEVANAHNQKLCNDIKGIIQEGATEEIRRSFLNEYEMNSLYLGMKEVALEMFDKDKMGNAEISKEHRDKLEQDLIDFRSTLAQLNRRRRFNSGWRQRYS